MNSQISKSKLMNSHISKSKLSPPLLSESSSSSSSETDDTSFSSKRFSHQDVKFQYFPCIPISESSSYQPLAILSSHIGSVSCLSLCGEFVLSASHGKDIIVWQWQHPDLRLFTKFGQGDGSVKSVVTVGNKVITSHQDGKIRVWKVSRSSESVFKLVETLPTTMDYLGKFMKQSNYVQTRRHHKRLWIEHSDSISCLTVFNGLIYSGSWDKTLKVWKMSNFKCLESIKAHEDAINGLVACKGVVYSASADGKIKAWGRKEGKMKKITHCLKGVLEGHKDLFFNSVVVSQDGKWVYGGGSNGFVMGWEKIEKTQNNSISGDLVTRSPNKRLNDQSVFKNDNPESWKLVCETKAHGMAVLCMCVMGEILFSGSSDKSIGIWKREGYGGKICKVGVINGHEGPVKCLEASYSSRNGGGFMLYSGSLDKSLRVWWVPKYIQEEIQENFNLSQIRIS